jgi:hypothetical protein
MGLGAAIAGGIGAVATVGTSIMGSNAAKSAASAQEQAAADSLAFQQGVYNNTTANLQPYVNTGTNALYSLASLYGVPTGANGTNGSGATPGSSPTNNGAMTAFNNFTQTPGYQFPLQQGQLSANRSLAASGLENSGGALKALTQYGQGYASTGFNNYLSQLSALANNGQNAAVQTGTAGNQAAQTVNNATNTYGTANASGIVGSANAINSGVNNLTGLLTSPSAYSSMGGTGGGSVLSNLGNSIGGLFSSGGSGAGLATSSDLLSGGANW